MNKKILSISQKSAWNFGFLIYALALASLLRCEAQPYEEINARMDKGDPDAKGLISVFIQEDIIDITEGQSITKSAFKLAEESANQGSPFGQYALGRIHEKGFGTKKDSVKATDLYRTAFPELKRAAESGDANGQWLLGDCFEFGRGVEKNEAEALKWYRKAADNGYPIEPLLAMAMIDSGEATVSSLDGNVVISLQQLAENGNATAQADLANRYMRGQNVNKNEEEAVKWYRKAAEQGDADAQFNLGLCYANGRGVAKDDAEAIKWYRKAAEQGHAKAQNNLGICYDNGQGVAKDEAEAVKWYRSAAEQGNKRAMNNLARTDKSLSNSEKNFWLYKAAETDSEFHGGPATEDVMKLTVDGKLHGANQPPKGLFALIKDSLFGDIKNKRLDEIKRSTPKDEGGKQVYPIRLVFRTPGGGVERWDLRFYKDDFGQWSVESASK